MGSVSSAAQPSQNPRDQHAREQYTGGYTRLQAEPGALLVDQDLEPIACSKQDPIEVRMREPQFAADERFVGAIDIGAHENDSIALVWQFREQANYRARQVLVIRFGCLDTFFLRALLDRSESTTVFCRKDLRKTLSVSMRAVWAA